VKEKCLNCGCGIGELETPFVWNERVVCRSCFKKLQPKSGMSKGAILAVAIVAIIAIVAGGTIWLAKSKSQLPSQAESTPVMPQASIPAVIPVPIVTSIVPTGPVAPPLPAMTIQDVQTFGERLARQMKYRDDEIDRSTNDGSDANSNSARVVRTDLKNSDSLVHPIVGEIVISFSHSTENKSIDYIRAEDETYTVTVFRDRDGWKCDKAVRKYENIIGAPEPTPDPSHAPGVEYDASTEIQADMQIPLP
jgi:hypothetical protein